MRIWGSPEDKLRRADKYIKSAREWRKAGMNKDALAKVVVAIALLKSAEEDLQFAASQE